MKNAAVRFLFLALGVIMVSMVASASSYNCEVRSNLETISKQNVILSLGYSKAIFEDNATLIELSQKQTIDSSNQEYACLDVFQKNPQDQGAFDPTVFSSVPLIPLSHSCVEVNSSKPMAQQFHYENHPFINVNCRAK